MATKFLWHSIPRHLYRLSHLAPHRLKQPSRTFCPCGNYIFAGKVSKLWHADYTGRAERLHFCLRVCVEFAKARFLGGIATTIINSHSGIFFPKVWYAICRLSGCRLQGIVVGLILELLVDPS